MRPIHSLLLAIILFSCSSTATEEKKLDATVVDTGDVSGTPFPFLSMLTPCDGFDFPIGKPPLKGYYNAQGFGKNTHLGDDWNGVGGGDSDLGDPVYAVADGIVFHADYVHEGWGNVIQVVHQVNESQYVESFYGHVQNMMVKEGEVVKRGQQIAEIGNADGAYPAHLHLEMRWKLGMEIGGGYSRDTSGFLDPTKFIKAY